MIRIEYELITKQRLETHSRLFRIRRLSAMGAVKIDHSDRAQHRAGIMQQLRRFWMDDRLCDVALKSHDGTEHRAHTAVLSAASVFFRNLLGGSFMEAERVQQKEPVEIAASKEAVSALLDYIYDGQPEVPVEVGLELLRLAEAYDLPKLAGDIEAGILACLDSSVALQVLQEEHGLHSLRDACEDKVAEEFETCSQHPDFGKLGASQLARILKRDDLDVSREEAVVSAIFTWNKMSKDAHAFRMLLQHVQFQSLSIENLLRLGRTTLSGLSGGDLQREVEGTLTSRKRTQNPGTFQSKRRRFQHWSPFLGAIAASIEASGREVLPLPCLSLGWHEGELFAVRFSSTCKIVCWKRGDPPTCVRRVAGEGATVAGINDLGDCRSLAISPSGEIVVTDVENQRLVRFQSGSGHLVVDNVDDALDLCYSPHGGLYVLSQYGTAVQKLVGSTLETVIASESLPEDIQFEARRVFATKEEVLYIVDNFNDNRRILSINPAESLRPVVVGQIPTDGPSFLHDLFVTDGGTIYVADSYQRKVFALHPSSGTVTEVLQCPDGWHPVALLVQDRSLYVSMVTGTSWREDPRNPKVGAVYEYQLPPELQLE